MAQKNNKERIPLPLNMKDFAVAFPLAWEPNQGKGRDKITLKMLFATCVEWLQISNDNFMSACLGLCVCEHCLWSYISFVHVCTVSVCICLDFETLEKRSSERGKRRWAQCYAIASPLQLPSSPLQCGNQTVRIKLWAAVFIRNDLEPSAVFSSAPCHRLVNLSGACMFL